MSLKVRAKTIQRRYQLHDIPQRCDLMTFVQVMPTPFTKANLERPASEGRSLHDAASSFLRNVMNVPTPISAANLPKSKEIQKTFLELDPVRDNVAHKFLLDLQATPLQDLWGEDSVSPPPTKEGLLWHAANALSKNDSDSAKNTSGNKRPSNSISKVKGRKKGAKGWSSKELDHLLDALKEILPTGRNHWEKVAAELVSLFPSFHRDANSCKKNSSG